MRTTLTRLVAGAAALAAAAILTVAGTPSASNTVNAIKIGNRSQFRQSQMASGRPQTRAFKIGRFTV